MAFILATGARLGESDRARPEDIALSERGVALRGTKTEASLRRVPIVGFGEPLMEHALAYANGRDGTLFSKWGNVRRDLAEACERAGIEKVSPNDLRRTFGTWLRQHGVEPHLIGAALGHTDSRMVERVYGRMPADSLTAVLQARLGECSIYVALVYQGHIWRTWHCKKTRFMREKQCPGTELNRRHADFQSAALPTELPGQARALYNKY